MNNSFKERLLHKLRHETYLIRNGNTLESIVDQVCVQFEKFDKKTVDLLKRPRNGYSIAGLRGDKDRGLTGIAAN